MIPRTIPLPKRKKGLATAVFGGAGQALGSSARAVGFPKGAKIALGIVGGFFTFFVIVALTMGIAPTPQTMTEPLVAGQSAN